MIFGYNDTMYIITHIMASSRIFFFLLFLDSFLTFTVYHCKLISNMTCRHCNQPACVFRRTAEWRKYDETAVQIEKRQKGREL